MAVAVSSLGWLDWLSGGGFREEDDDKSAYL